MDTGHVHHGEGGHPESGAKDSGTDAPAPDKTPITGLTASTWTWVPFPDALCRDGSSTGIGVNLGTSNNLMIFLEGGGACFNFESCLGGNPSSFNESDFNSLTTSTWEPEGYSANVGIFDRTNAANPVQDWSFVYVPYCTGDLHAGNAVGTVSGVTGEQKFMGYENIGLYLDRVIPTFPKVSQVLLAGMSAGGLGAALNYVRVAKAFGSTPVTMLDDSGPFMENPYLVTCMQSEVVKLWGIDKTVLPECGASCMNPASYILDYVKYAVKTYPNVSFGLADSTADETISAFFGYGADNCTKYVQVSGATLTAGLLDIRTQVRLAIELR